MGYTNDESPAAMMGSIARLDVDAVLAFRMTEIVEFAISLFSAKNLAVSNQSAAQSKKSFSFSGLFSTSSSAPSESTLPPSSDGKGKHFEGVSQIDFGKVLLALGPLKLKFAMAVADFGLTKEASEYTSSLKQNIGKPSVHSIYRLHGDNV